MWATRKTFIVPSGFFLAGPHYSIPSSVLVGRNLALSGAVSSISDQLLDGWRWRIFSYHESDIFPRVGKKNGILYSFLPKDLATQTLSIWTDRLFQRSSHLLSQFFLQRFSLHLFFLLPSDRPIIQLYIIVQCIHMKKASNHPQC